MIKWSLHKNLHQCPRFHKSVSRQPVLNRTLTVSRLLLWKAVLIVTLEADTNAPTVLVVRQSTQAHTSTESCSSTINTNWIYWDTTNCRAAFQRGLPNDFNFAKNPKAGVNRSGEADRVTDRASHSGENNKPSVCARLCAVGQTSSTWENSSLV